MHGESDKLLHIVQHVSQSVNFLTSLPSHVPVSDIRVIIILAFRSRMTHRK